VVSNVESKPMVQGERSTLASGSPMSTPNYAIGPLGQAVAVYRLVEETSKRM